ncbi:MAG TPA: hypothetical protein H9881_12935 [Candidatus Stackebrandtia excrementipullorum]|nr:hypothetical protein [Candidatus Stackebrandtia excrementipullorum]
MTDDPDLNEELIEKWGEDNTPQGFEKYLYSQGMFPPGYAPDIEYDVGLYYPPGNDDGILIWSTSKFDDAPSADDEEDDDAGSWDDITIPSEDI